MKSQSFFIETGMLEPIHLKVNERKQLAEGMWESVESIHQEFLNTSKRFTKTFNQSCEELNAKL